MKQLLAGAWLASGAAVFAADLTPLQAEFFESKIRPVLVERCYKCHSAQAVKTKGGLLLDTREGVLKGGDTGPAIVPGDPAKSLLIKAIKRGDPDSAMPPKGKSEPLSAEQVADFELWVKDGAPDPRTGPVAVAVSVIDRLLEKARTHWAFQPVKPSARTGGGHLIDGLQPSKSPPANARTLVRRAYLGLIGIPPTPEQADAFAAAAEKDAPHAFDQLLDELLASPRYGERWGRHWLDVARYADNMGAIFNGDDTYPFAFTYRDWVIGAFNDDLPYDRFLLQQLAADLLPDQKLDDNRSQAALGFLTVGRRTDRRVDDNVYDDRIDVISRGLLGMTVGCARCHDHKLEPIPTKDYYSLYGVLKSCAESEVYPPMKPQPVRPESAEYEEKNRKARAAYAEGAIRGAAAVAAAARKRVGDYLLTAQEAQWKNYNEFKPVADVILKRKLQRDLYNPVSRSRDAWVKKQPQVFGPWLEFGEIPAAEFAAKAGEIAQRAAKNAELHPLVAQLFEAGAPASLEEVAQRYNTLFAGIDDEWRKLAADSIAKSAALNDADLEVPVLKLQQQAIARMDEVEATLPLPDAAREQLRQVLIAKDSPMKIPPTLYSGSRLFSVEDTKTLDGLARPIADLGKHPGAPIRLMALREDKPADAKVLIRGNPKTPGPDAPRQYFTALRSPDAPPFPKDQSGRLQLAQAIASRDNPLTARVIVNRVWAWHFGEGLVKTPSDFGLRGERPTNPELLDALAGWFMENGWSFKKLHRLILTSRAWQESQRTQPLDFEAFRDSVLAVAGALDNRSGGKPDDLVTGTSNRRTVYAFVDRKTLPSLFRSFDFPDPSFSAPQRSRTALTPQALFLLNSPFVVDRAKDLAKLTKPDSAGAEPAALHALYRRAFQREPSDHEMQRAQAFLASYPEHDLVMPEVDDWSYGTGEFDAAAQRVANFKALKFAGDKVVGADGVELNRDGGQPGKDKAIVRRWTAPRDGRVNIYAELAHLVKEGDGVSSRIVSSRHGPLGEWTAAHNAVLTTLNDIEIKKGDTLDFLTVCRGDAKGDTFHWSPTITMPTSEMPGMAGMAMRWDAKSDFMDPAKLPKPLTAWEELAQVLLLSNEFSVVE